MNAATAWRWFNMLSVPGAIAVWVLATKLGWVRSIAFVSHVTMATAVQTAIAMYMGSRAEKKAEQSS